MMWNIFGVGGSGWFDIIVTIVWWVVIVIGIVAIFRWIRDSQGFDRDRRSAADILKQRFARGDIDRKEFEEKMSVLNKGTTDTTEE